MSAFTREQLENKSCEELVNMYNNEIIEMQAIVAEIAFKKDCTVLLRQIISDKSSVNYEDNDSDNEQLDAKKHPQKKSTTSKTPVKQTKIIEPQEVEDNDSEEQLEDEDDDSIVDKKTLLNKAKTITKKISPKDNTNVVTKIEVVEEPISKAKTTQNKAPVKAKVITKTIKQDVENDTNDDINSVPVTKKTITKSTAKSTPTKVNVKSTAKKIIKKKET